MNNNDKSTIIRFLTAQTVSLFGSSLVQYAIIWYITLTTSSGVMMSIATLCGYLPQIAISLFAGVWLDRYDRKRMMMGADAIIALSTLGVALLFINGFTSIYALFFVLIIRSAGTGIQTPAVNAFIPELVPSESLMKVNGIQTTLSSIIMFLSPALSGAILSFISIELTFFIDVITAIIAILIMFSVHAKQPRSAIAHTTMKADMKIGFQYVKQHKNMQYQLLFLLVVALLISPSAFLTPLLVSRSFGAEVWRLTYSEMTFSLGAVIGGILISRWGGFANRNTTIICATIGYGFMMLGIGIAPIFFIYLLFNTLIGITMPCYNTPVTVALQEGVEPHMHGRIFSMVQLVNACALPLGTIIFGTMADYTTIQSILLCNGTLVIFFALFYIRKHAFS